MGNRVAPCFIDVSKSEGWSDRGVIDVLLVVRVRISPTSEGAGGPSVGIAEVAAGERPQPATS